MAKVELIMPKMGESVAEATVIKWLKNVGDTIEIDESVLEIATDKVDSEIPSSIEGVLVKQLFKEDDVVLDPFLGSGTTALACIKTKRKFIGFEINEKYINISNKLINKEINQLKIF